MKADPRNSASKYVAQENRQGPDSEGRPGKKRKRYEWMVTEVRDTWIKMKRRRVDTFRSPNFAVFQQLLNDPIIEQFLRSDVNDYSSHQGLFTVMVKYLSHLEFRQEDDVTVHYFLKLCAACEIDTMDLSCGWLIFPAIFGSNWYQDSLRQFWSSQMEFLNSVDWKAWLSQEISEEVSGDEKRETPLPPEHK
ncbi:speedy protein E4A-like [Notamacropus eugenii]|uniref:speedy protein E4A-like n=1 Tax=Notamacropus eugenii TaxID=9315 RepID=UPI003B6783D0